MGSLAPCVGGVVAVCVLWLSLNARRNQPTDLCLWVMAVLSSQSCSAAPDPLAPRRLLCVQLGAGPGDEGGGAAVVA